MLLRNLSVALGIVNGSIGTVHSIIFPENAEAGSAERPECIVVHFPDFKGSSCAPDKDKCVPVFLCGIETVLDTTDKSRVKVRRTQFPLELAYAITIHKSQGVTSPGPFLVHLGSKEMSPGLTFVALSRGRSWNDLYLSSASRERFNCIMAAQTVVRHATEATPKTALLTELIRLKTLAISLRKQENHLNAHTDELAAEVIRLQALLEQTRSTKTTARREVTATAVSRSVAAIPTGATTRAGRQVRRVVDENFDSS